MKKMQKSLFSITGYLLFFVLIALVATCSILTYSLVFEMTDGDKTISAVVTLLVLVILTLVCTIFDAVRRKFTVVRPVQSIVDAGERITGGDFTVQLKPFHSYGKYNEFDIIIENINRMARELEKNEMLKKDFIANVSHEIKTPLSIIQNYAVALGDENLDAQTKSDYIKTLLSASNRLANLITNILKLNKLENQEIFVEKTNIDLGEQLRENILSFEDKIEEKLLDVECDIDDIDVVSDEGLLNIIWSNLISNAIKFSDIGGKITVLLKDRKEYAEIIISDTGCGMSTDVGNRIFDKFFQGDVSRSTEGNGLGLALVKRVIDILGGDIGVESEIGKGSTFAIKIRKRPE